MKLTTKKYLIPFVLITSLFFLWGFARAILDVLNQHFRDSMNISITESALIQVTTYLAYFLAAVPAGMFISKFGYRKGVVSGLLLYALGALLFIWGASVGTLTAFLVCLFIIGVGLTFLEVSANPYSTELGPKETATSRLNLSQSFNGLGCMLAPMLVGGYLFTGGDVMMPYLIMGIIVVCIAVVFMFIKLPEVTPSPTLSRKDGEQTRMMEVSDASAINVKEEENSDKLTKIFWFGLVALLAYEVAEISINSYFVLYLTGEDYCDKMVAKDLLSLALGIFMCGRFIGAWVMQRISPAMVLAICAVGSVACMIGVLFMGKDAMYALVVNFAFESIMFPTIFSLAVDGLEGKAKKRASSLLMMTPVGGCAFLLMGWIADSTSLTLPFLIPLLGYMIVMVFAWKKK